MIMQISEAQQDIINTSKDTIVIANPGTGKTTTLSLKVIKLLEEGVNPERYLMHHIHCKGQKRDVRCNSQQRQRDAP